MYRSVFLVCLFAVPLSIAAIALIWPPILWAFLVVGPIAMLGVHDLVQTKHALNRVYPVIGHGRYLMESIRPEMQQYFVESNIDGRPFSREFRSLVYQRAKNVQDTKPFGTLRDLEADGYEWMHHSLAPKPSQAEEPRVIFGGKDCTQPYAASHLNISAMSFGSLSKNAIRALNRGAALGGFAHNTGEGGISPYHLEPGGDLIWQVGTGYFGCRAPDGGFDAKKFEENATRPQVKMIELKLSQGAKPGHGGILPAEKLTPEIAEIRGVPLGKDVLSPPHHSAFSTPRGLLEFIAELRRLSGGKPVGFKLCVGKPEEFLSICKAMAETGLLPDFITVDGGEGGTGAAPLEFSNSVGMPLRDGLALVHSALTGIGVRDQVRIIASGKIISAFHLLRILALGADTVNSARGMMFALGCIQAMRCNSNDCPVGVATQNPHRAQGLVVSDKAQRVANFHSATIRASLELLGAGGLEDPQELSPRHILRRVDDFTVRTLDELLDTLPEGALLDPATMPASWANRWAAVSPDSF